MDNIDRIAQVLGNEISDLISKRREMAAAIQNDQQRLAVIDAQIDIAKKIHNQLSQNTPKADTRPTDAILDLLYDHPDGLTNKQIVDALELKIRSRSQKKRRILCTVICQLVKTGRLSRDLATRCVTLIPTAQRAS